MFAGTTWILSALLISAGAESPAEEDGVLVLTATNFDEAIKDATVLVEFYAPWCGHCKALEPEYAKAAATLKENGSDVKLAKVDVTVEKELGEKYKVQGFPTIKFFKSGLEEPMEYGGGRDAAGIVAWIEKKTGPPCAQISGVSDLKKLVEAGVVVVAFFDDLTSDNAKLFESIAEADDRAKYVFATGDELRKEYSAKDGSVVLLKSFDELKAVYEGALEKEALTAFINTNSRPNIYEFSQESAQQIFEGTIKQHIIILSAKSDEKHAERFTLGQNLGKKFKESVIMVHMDTDLEENKGVLEFFGVQESDLPLVVAFEMESSKKYLPENKDITEENLSSFITEFVAGKLKPHLKSEALPEDWDAEDVKVLVASNFNEVAMDKTKDVFVEFYAPWCGHCKNLEPVWMELGEAFKDREDIVIAKIDSTANELEDIEIQGFPTIKIFKKDTNEIVDYQGKKDLASMVKFLETGDFEVGPDDAGDSGEDYDEDDEEGSEEDYPDSTEENVKDEL